MGSGGTRGNQRDLAREKNAKNAPKQTQHDKDGLTVAQRKARDEAAMAAKVAAKAAAAAAGK